MSVIYKDNPCCSLLLISPTFSALNCELVQMIPPGVSNSLHPPKLPAPPLSHYTGLIVWVCLSWLMIPLSILTDLFNCIPVGLAELCVHPQVGDIILCCLPDSNSLHLLFRRSSSILYWNSHRVSHFLAPSLGITYILIGWLWSTRFMSCADVQGQCREPRDLCLVMYKVKGLEVRKVD